jgi:hypothetical protein
MRFMTDKRFEHLQRILPWAIADTTISPLGDPRYRARSGISRFNENSARTVIKSDWFTPDKSMIAWEPQTTKTDGLPNISFITRKPLPLGSELKDVADGRSGLSFLWGSKSRRGNRA